MKSESGRKVAVLVGMFTMAMVARLGVLSDGKMGASKARAERIKTAVMAAENAAREWS